MSLYDWVWYLITIISIGYFLLGKMYTRQGRKRLIKGKEVPGTEPLDLCLGSRELTRMINDVFSPIEAVVAEVERIVEGKPKPKPINDEADDHEGEDEDTLEWDNERQKWVPEGFGTAPLSDPGEASNMIPLITNWDRNWNPIHLKASISHGRVVLVHRSNGHVTVRFENGITETLSEETFRNRYEERS